MSNDTSDPQAHAVAVRNRSIIMLAGAAVLASLTAPMWGPMLLNSVNVHSGPQQQVLASRAVIEGLEQRVGGLDQRVVANTAAAEQTVAAAVLEVKAVDKAEASMASLAVTELGAALRQPGGFVQQLALARAAVKATPELTELVRKIEPYGETGVPGREQLRREFDRLHATVAPPATDMTPSDWLRRAMGRAAANDATGQGLADTRRLLFDDDLPSAIAVARAIPEPRPDWLGDWIDDASARVAADGLIQRLEKLAETRGRNGRP